MADLQIIPLKNNLLLDWKKQDVKTKIISRVNELNINVSQYKTDNEFLTLICNLIEYLVTKKDNINKKELVLSVYNDLFGLTPEEQETLKNNIDIVHLQKKIKAVSYWKLFKCGFKEFLFVKRHQSKHENI
jgi:Leucine-rich repeat (LRR) protein